MRLNVRVIPRSSKNKLEWQQGTLKARLTAPPVDGAANEALIALLAERLGLPKRNVMIVHGAASRLKTVEIVGMTPEAVEQKLMGDKGKENESSVGRLARAGQPPNASFILYFMAVSKKFPTHFPSG